MTAWVGALHGGIGGSSGCGMEDCCQLLSRHWYLAMASLKTGGSRIGRCLASSKTTVAMAVSTTCKHCGHQNSQDGHPDGGRQNGHPDGGQTNGMHDADSASDCGILSVVCTRERSIEQMDTGSLWHSPMQQQQQQETCN